MRRLIWSHEAELSLEQLYEEYYILTGETAADMKLESIINDAEELCEYPDIGDGLVIDGAIRNWKIRTCPNGYLIYEIQDDIIYILSFVRTIDLPEFLKLNFKGGA